MYGKAKSRRDRRNHLKGACEKHSPKESESTRHTAGPPRPPRAAAAATTTQHSVWPATAW